MVVLKEKEMIELEHQCKMEQLKYIRDTERLKHEWELERQRIKTAEIKKVKLMEQHNRGQNLY